MPYFIGDVHGKYSRYRELIRDKKDTIQVGDMGVGFRYTQGPKAGELRGGPPYDAMVAGNHRFIRGNHDNPQECAKHTQWILDGWAENGMIFCGGAVSIDREYRIPNYSYWDTEELTSYGLDLVTDIYRTTKPEIMVTHDCPQFLAETMVGLGGNGAKLDPRHASRTRQAFESMLHFHKPKLWVYGHWHHSFDAVIDGTRFVCLAELEGRELNI